MARQANPEDMRLVVGFLRVLRMWSQEELSAASGVDRGIISDYERGKAVPQPKTLKRLTAAVGLPYTFVDTLLPVFRAARLAVEGRPEEGGPAEADTAARLAAGLDRAIYEAVVPRVTPFVLELAASLEDSGAEPRKPGGSLPVGQGV